MSVETVPIAPAALSRFEGVLRPDQWEQVRRAVDRASTLMAGHVVWNVNSTARGGGVAEMLQSLVGYARSAGVDTRWMVVSGDPGFFEVTKRIHNRLHGSPGDGGPLGDAERRAYEAPLHASAAALAELMGPDDLVILHDPQTAGLVPALRETGARIAWRSHIGYETPDELALEAWRFLLPYVEQADACIFSRPAYAWGGIEAEKLVFIHPSIDAFSPKNQELEPDAVQAILVAAGVIDGPGDGIAAFTRADGTPAHLVRRAALVEDSRLAPDTPVVLQVSRWDRLKDPLGVIAGFADHVPAASGAHLVFAGPATAAVSDDPEGAEVFAEAWEAWQRLGPGARARVHLASLPMDDADENAAMVNALQRHARVVCQKSIAEGFGLTVAEAMWKCRPVVATRVGGIQDQIDDGTSGLLVDDPHDLRSFGGAVTRVLEDPDLAERLGREAHRRVRDEFLGPQHLLRYLELFQGLLTGAPVRA